MPGEAVCAGQRASRMSGGVGLCRPMPGSLAPISVVGPVGLEPTTYGLKVRVSVSEPGAIAKEQATLAWPGKCVLSCGDTGGPRLARLSCLRGAIRTLRWLARRRRSPRAAGPDVWHLPVGHDGDRRMRQRAVAISDICMRSCGALCRLGGGRQLGVVPAGARPSVS